MGEGPKNSLPPPGQLPGGAEIWGRAKWYQGGGVAPLASPPESGPGVKDSKIVLVLAMTSVIFGHFFILEKGQSPTLSTSMAFVDILFL